MSEKKSKNIVIIALCITLIFMGVGFAALSETLTVTGTANITGTWDIKITNIQAVEAQYAHTAVTGSSNLANFAADANSNTKTNGIHGLVGGLNTIAATFNVDLNEPGDYVIYKITVTNNGTITAKLNTNGLSLIDNSPEVLANGNFAGTGETGTKLFLFTMQSEESGVYSDSTPGSIASGMGTLTATGTQGAVDYYYVKVEYNSETALVTTPDSNHNSAVGTLTMNYVQNDNAS